MEFPNVEPSTAHILPLPALLFPKPLNTLRKSLLWWGSRRPHIITCPQLWKGSTAQPRTAASHTVLTRRFPEFHACTGWIVPLRGKSPSICVSTSVIGKCPTRIFALQRTKLDSVGVKKGRRCFCSSLCF